MLSQVLRWMPTNLRQYCQMIDFGSKSKATFETVSMFYVQLSYLPAVILYVARFGPKSKNLQSHQHMYCLFGEY